MAADCWTVGQGAGPYPYTPTPTPTLPLPLMQAIVQMVKEPGAKDTAMLHAAAMKLSVPFVCEWTSPNP